jgi:hypothetical protein
MTSNLTARGQKIAALEAKLAELKEAERLSNQRKKSAQSRAERAAATRRKILVGAFVLDQFSDLSKAAAFTISNSSFASWLTRDSDRALFGLMPLAAPAPEPASRQAQNAGDGQ